ncbi:hypothetical protein [Streptomyces sp. NPDC088358]|uniref:hypothetical protein n=1 Tax=Streptomyces sp. NPDC088358 TaxID=3365857 RepID=UPI0038024B68
MTDRTPPAQAVTLALVTPVAPVTRRERRLRLLKAVLLMAVSLAAFAAELLHVVVCAPDRHRRRSFAGDIGGDTGGGDGGGDG